MNEKKYELTGVSMILNGRTLHRIIALRDFGNVKKGDLGGWIEKEENLSHECTCWVSDEACVYGDAKVSDNAEVFNNVMVCEYAQIYGNAQVYGNAWVYGNAKVYGNALVFNTPSVYDNAKVYGNAQVSGNARVYGSACVFGIARLFNNTEVYGDAHISGNAYISGETEVYGDAHISGNSQIYGRAYISNNAKISKTSDYFLAESIGSRDGFTTFFKCSDNIIRVNCGCFNGTLDEFRDAVQETHGDNKFAKEYLMLAELVEMRWTDECDNN